MTARSSRAAPDAGTPGAADLEWRVPTVAVAELGATPGPEPQVRDFNYLGV